MRLVIHAFAFAIWVGGSATTYACQCADPPGVRGEELSVLRLNQATDVVRGRITDVQASVETKRKGFRVVVAHMKVTSIVRGEASIGDATIVTGFGTGDCGIPGFLLHAVARDSDATLQVKRNPEVPAEYWVDMCGYGSLDPVRASRYPK